MFELKAPKFWQNRNAISFALTPLSCLYAIAHITHQKMKKPFKADIPVICVGNAVMGGSGKTPTVIALLEFVKEHGFAKNPFVLTRGYGGSLNETTRVDDSKHTSHEVGDEALLLARHAPVVKSSDRKKGAQFAQSQGADMIIMDDGLQNKGLHQDIKILIVDAEYGFGNERLFPAGPMRTPLRHALNNADIMITIGKRTDGYSLFSLDENTPTLWAYLTPESSLKENTKYIGFAGIGMPLKFKRSLEQAGAQLADFQEFPDHHAFSKAELETLKKDAKEKEAQLITTEKDFIRIPLAYRKYIDTFPVSLQFEEQEDLLLALTAKLKHDENIAL